MAKRFGSVLPLNWRVMETNSKTVQNMGLHFFFFSEVTLTVDVTAMHQ